MANRVGMLLLLICMAGAAFAGQSSVNTPEIDASAGVSALAMLGGACLILRARKKR